DRGGGEGEGAVPDSLFQDPLKMAGDLLFLLKDIFHRLLRERLGLLVDQKDVIGHLPHDTEQLGDRLLQALPAGVLFADGLGQPPLQFEMDIVADQVEDILLGLDIFVHRADAETAGPGDFPGGRLVKTLADEQVDGPLDDLPPPLFNQPLILDERRNRFAALVHDDPPLSPANRRASHLRTSRWGTSSLRWSRSRSSRKAGSSISSERRCRSRCSIRLRTSRRRWPRRRAAPSPLSFRWVWCRWSCRHSSSIPRRSVATVGITGGRQAVFPARSSISSRSAINFRAPSRSALFTRNRSAISMIPAFHTCTISPAPGVSTRTTVSASSMIVSSVWPTPTVSTRMMS